MNKDFNFAEEEMDDDTHHVVEPPIFTLDEQQIFAEHHRRFIDDVDCLVLEYVQASSEDYIMDDTLGDSFLKNVLRHAEFLSPARLLRLKTVCEALLAL